MITIFIILVVAVLVAAGYLYYLGDSAQDDIITQELERSFKAQYQNSLFKPEPREVNDLDVIEPEFVKKEVVKKVVQLAKILPEDTTINLEALQPAKKKRKYYPKKKK